MLSLAPALLCSLTVLRLLPNDALQVDAGAWLTGPQALRLGGQSHVRRVDGDGARADHDLFTGRRDLAVCDWREEVERRWRRGGCRRIHLRGRQRGEEGEETRTTQPTSQAETLQNLNDDPDVEHSGAFVPQRSEC